MHTAEHHAPIYTYIGQRIRERRKRLKLNQTDLAELMGFSYQQMQKYETGSSRVSAGKLLLFAKILNVPPNYFYDGLKLDESIGERIETHVIQRSRTRPLRLLLVENNPADVIAFQKAVSAQPEGAEIHVEHHGESAMDFLQGHPRKQPQNRPDLVVLELDVPGMHGVDILRSIKQNSGTATLPVIVLTNSINAKDLAEAYRRGAAGFIQKAVDPQEYAESIGVLMKYWSKTVALPGC